jgi:hypothetical protein
LGWHGAKEFIMNAFEKMALVLVLAVMSGGAVMAETGSAKANARAVKTAAWDRVGDGAGVVDLAADPARVRIRALGGAVDGGLQARKAEMVRRMFWIMLAHR